MSFGGLFQSESASQTTSTSISKPDTSAQTISGGGSILKIGENGSYTGLDLDALKSALDFARQVYEESQLTFADVIGLTEQTNKAAVESSKAASEMIATAYQTAQGKESPIDYKYVLMGGMALVAVLGLAVLLRKRKK